MMHVPLPPVTYTQFITTFPEFSNAAVYPQSQVDIWIPHGYAQLNANRFRSQLPLAVMLFVAHNIVLSARAVASANSGAIPGEPKGVVTAKAIGDVSAGFDAAVVSIEGAGIWNSTVYGQRLYKMMQAYGSGPAYATQTPAYGYAPGFRRRPR